MAYTKCVSAVYAAGSGNPSNIPPCAKQSPSYVDQAGAAFSGLAAIGNATSMLQSLFNALPSYGIHIAMFFVALMLIIIGLWILGSGGQQS